MKKILAFAATAAAIVAFASCNKEENGKKDKEEDKGGETADLISVDGDFADWDKAEGVVIGTPAEGGSTGVKVAKFVSDGETLYGYAEVAKELVSAKFEPANVWGADNPTPFRLIMDVDGSDKTGGSDTHWMDEVAGYDLLVDAYIWCDGSKVVGNWSQLWYFKSGATVGDAIISNIEQDPGYIDPDQTMNNQVISEFAGKVEAGYAKFEFAIPLDNLKGVDGDKVIIGCYMYPVNWGSEVALPHALTVSIKK